jgi:FdrA protein
MTTTLVEIRRGAYYDSIVLMQLQAGLGVLTGVLDTGVIMGTPSNKDMLAQSGLLTPEVEGARPDDLVIVVKAEDETGARSALAQVDGLLTQRRSTLQQEYRPQSLETANQMLPEAGFVLISVAGRYAGGVTRQALDLGKHVFLFSDNVPVEEEIELKRRAAERGLLVMGPDCGTAIIDGVGLGFANKVRRGPIGVVAAAGTGLQQVTSRIHQLGGGVAHGIGTGGRDLSEKVGAVTFRQGIDLLARDPEVKVIVLVSKPPAPAVAEQVLEQVEKADKPVVVSFVGRSPTAETRGPLHFAHSLDHAAELAVALAGRSAEPLASRAANAPAGVSFAPGQRYLRGLFSGGTLAYEAQAILRDYLPGVWANAPLDKAWKLPNSLHSQDHTIVDLGEDEFTVGRLHPMLDNELRIRRLLHEASDPQVAVIVLDIVLGYGSHPDPAAELGPAIARAIETAHRGIRRLDVLVVLTGTDEDPQDIEAQRRKLVEAGAVVDFSNEAIVRRAGEVVRELAPRPDPAPFRPVPLESLQAPLAAINVGLESFAETLQAQGAEVVQVDWRPPAGGNERLMAILARMNAK